MPDTHAKTRFLKYCIAPTASLPATWWGGRGVVTRYRNKLQIIQSHRDSTRNCGLQHICQRKDAEVCQGNVIACRLCLLQLLSSLLFSAHSNKNFRRISKARLWSQATQNPAISSNEGGKIKSENRRHCYAALLARVGKVGSSS